MILWQCVRFSMEYEVEYDVLGRVPECGAIFMSNASTKRECFRRKLLGLPSAQANFVKQIKAGMVLFLFEYERRELYGVFRACSDGSTNIVPHAFTSFGKQFPAQVRFTSIWYCDPLTEYEFQDAIKENYYSKKKFNFGLSEDQVRRLLCLFSSRKLQKPHRPFQRQVSKSMGKERSIAGDDYYFLRNRAEKFVEDDSLVLGTDAKYPGNASRNNGRKLNSNIIKNDGIQNDLNGSCCQGYDILTEPPSVSFGNRRNDDDDKFFMQNSMAYYHDLDQGRVIHIKHPGDSVNSERVAEERKFSLTKHNMGSNSGPIASPKYFWESLAKVGRATDNGRFSQVGILGDKYTPNHVFGLVTSTGHLENSTIQARASDDREFFANCGVENDYNFANYPDPAISADPPLSGRLRTSDKEVFFGNDRNEIGQYSDYGMGEVRNESSDGNFLRSNRVDVPSENFANRLDCASIANDHDRFLARLSMENGNTIYLRYPLDKTKRVSDEGILKKTDGLDNAYTMQNSFRLPNFQASTSVCQSRQSTAIFSRNLETKNSFCQDQPKLRSALPPSMEQKTFGFSCPTYHDAMVTRTVPYDPEVAGIHCRNLSSFAVDCNSCSIQDMPLHQNSNGNRLTASFIGSLPYFSEAEDLSRRHDVASGFGNKLPLPTSPNYYTHSGLRTNSSLLSAECHGKMEAKAASQEVYNGSLFPEATSTSPHYSRSDMYERQNGSPFSEFDNHALTSQGRYEQKSPQYENSQVLRVDDASFNKNKGYLHSCSSNGKSNNWDTQYYYQNAKGKPTDSKSKRTSVFARLTSEVHARESSDVSCSAEEESNFYLQYDECDMGASVDQVMDEIFEGRKSSLVRKRDMLCDRLKMPTSKMEDDVEHVIEVNWNEIVEETRVVSFKRRSETKKIKDNASEKTSVDTSEHERECSFQKSGREGSEGTQHKRRKLVRPVFGRKLQLNKGLSSDGSPNLQVSSSGHIDGTGNLDDSAKSRDNEDCSSPNSMSVQLTSLSGCKGKNACIKQSLYYGGKKYLYYDRKESFDGGTKRASTSNLQVSSREGFNAKENTGCCIGLTRSHESDNISSQDGGLICVTNPTIC
ncbi:uncharacterized protein LOC131312671 [Rhododendron vialii]|uniref:uncharacterized protein LOC131312671 n=1 Tax=Rhododendron vialii TaxID=182163 RepID=UPI00265F1DA3|nr:uncharacterized protein LOC131312671 [Rhododendron vialii]